MTYLIRILISLVSIPLLMAEIVEWWTPSTPLEASEFCHYTYEDGESIVKCTFGQRETTPSNALRFVHGKHVCKILIVNSNVKYISKGTFWYISAEVVQLRDSVIETLNLFEAFDGIQNTLKGIEIENVTVNNWLLSSVEEFSHLQKFELSGCPNKSCDLAQVISYLPKHICQILIRGCLINLGGYFFKSFENLRVLQLREINLKSLFRTYFPVPAENLYSIDLSFNPITSLPIAMFNEMPALKVVILESASLTILPHYVFKDVLLRLHTLKFEGNLFSCTCDTAWILLRKHVWDLSNIVCRSPRSLKDRKFQDILPINLCMDCDKLLPSGVNE